MALALVGAALAVAVEGLAAMATQRRIVERQAAALVALDQVLEHVAALPWDEIDADRITRFELPESLLQSMPSARIVALVQPQAGPPSAKRVAVSLHWKTLTGEEASPELYAWCYQTAEGTP